MVDPVDRPGRAAAVDRRAARPGRRLPADRTRTRIAVAGSGSCPSVAPGSSGRGSSVALLAGERPAARAVLRHPDAVAVATTVEPDRRPEDGRLVGPRRGRDGRDGRRRGRRRLRIRRVGRACRAGCGPPTEAAHERDERAPHERRHHDGSSGGRGGGWAAERTRHGSSWLWRGGSRGWRPFGEPAMTRSGPPRTAPERPTPATLSRWVSAAFSDTARAGRRPAWRRSSTACGHAA